MELASRQLNRLFSMYLKSDAEQSSLHDLSIAYGLLVKEGVVNSRQQLCDTLCQEVGSLSQSQMLERMRTTLLKAVAFM